MNRNAVSNWTTIYKNLILIKQSKNMKLSLSILVLLVLMAGLSQTTSSRAHLEQGKHKQDKEEEKLGSYLGNLLSVAARALRGKKWDKPINSKVRYGKPPKEGSSAAFRFKEGLEGFRNLAYILCAAAVSAMVYSICAFGPVVIRRMSLLWERGQRQVVHERVGDYSDRFKQGKGKKRVN